MSAPGTIKSNSHGGTGAGESTQGDVLIARMRALLKDASPEGAKELHSVCMELVTTYPRSAVKADAVYPIWRRHYTAITAEAAFLDGGQSTGAGLERAMAAAHRSMSNLYMSVLKFGNTAHGTQLIYKCIVYLGDVERYQEKYRILEDERDRQFTSCKQRYVEAIRMLPGYGLAHNQLALTHAHTGDMLYATYAYLRSMFASVKPFAKAEGNLVALLDAGNLDTVNDDTFVAVTQLVLGAVRHALRAKATASTERWDDERGAALAAALRAPSTFRVTKTAEIYFAKVVLVGAGVFEIHPSTGTRLLDAVLPACALLAGDQIENGDGLTNALAGLEVGLRWARCKAPILLHSPALTAACARLLRGLDQHYPPTDTDEVCLPEDVEVLGYRPMVGLSAHTDLTATAPRNVALLNRVARVRQHAMLSMTLPDLDRDEGAASGLPLCGAVATPHHPQPPPWPGMLPAAGGDGAQPGAGPAAAEEEEEEEDEKIVMTPLTFISS